MVVAQPRVRAPELRGRGWLNTDGQALTLASLRGRFVLLDFWTFCCVNCLHVIDELRPLEERYGPDLVVIGVHSPKFEHEKNPAAVVAAVERYGVRHPVLDDPELRMWQEYAARAWPTLVVIDPEGYVVATMAGEGHAAGLARLLDELIEHHRAKGTLRSQPDPGAALAVAEPPFGLRFPGKALVLPGGTILVADSANHRLVELAPDFYSERRVIGTGTRGRADGVPDQAQFSEPGGLCLLPPDIARTVGYDLVVADTVNHLLRGVRLDTGEVSTVAGSGRPWRGTADRDAHDSIAVDLSSPWDVAWFDGRVVVAMAGIHQLWWFDPIRRTAGSYAGTAVEALRDGPLDESWMAQPSGLSAAPDGTRLWVVDSESSALRYVEAGALHTVVGQGLFDFGLVDGPAADALLQHPLGVLALPDGSVLVADTYNGAVRRYDPTSDTLATLATRLAEPSDLVLAGDGTVLVVESAAHRLIPLAPTEGDAGPTPGTRHRMERPPTALAAGTVTLDVLFEPAPGEKLDDTFGTPTRLEVSASPPELLISGGGVTTDLTRQLVISADVPSGVLQVSAQSATCDADAEHAACHLTRQDWGVPIEVHPTGADRLALVLRAAANG